MNEPAGQHIEPETNKVTVGVLADPEAAPAQIGLAMGDELAEALAQRLDDNYQWEVQVRLQRLPAGTSDGHFQMMDTAAQRRESEGWDLVVCITDLPVRHGRQPLVADTDPYRRVGQPRGSEPRIIAAAWSLGSNSNMGDDGGSGR